MARTVLSKRYAKEVMACVLFDAHGPGGRYRGSYSGTTLERWAETIMRWRRERHDVFVYLDNDQKAAAPRDAQRLMRLVGASDN
jgi:uncharacterized protein YecE (DUF72 family)